MTNKLFTVLLLIILTLTTITTAYSNSSTRILASTLPMYLITKNLLKDLDGVELDILIPAELGCPHDYALTPKDMKKLSQSDIMIINGLNLEEFIGAPVKRANSNITVIDSSEGIADLLEYTSNENKDEEHHEANHEHIHSGINPHLFVSPRMRIKIAENIAKNLKNILPKNSQSIVNTNLKRYKAEMQILVTKLNKIKEKLKNNRIIQPHGVFDYLAKDAGLDIIATIQPHGDKPSASRMIELIKLIKSEKIAAIITEPQYSSKVAKTISREAGIPVIELNPVASGNPKAPIDFYTSEMRKNIDLLITTLGENK